MTNEEMIKEFDNLSDEKKKKVFCMVLNIRDIQSSIITTQKDNIELLERQIVILETFIRKHHPDIEI